MKNLTDFNPALVHASIGAITLATLGLIAAQPASAAFVSLQTPVIGGTSGSNTLWCSNSNNGLVPAGNLVPCALVPGGSNLGSVLNGGPGNPGGNVELNNLSLPGFDFTKFTSLSGTLNGKSFFARSLTANDWFDNDNAFTKKFLTDALQVNAFDPTFFEPAKFDTLVNTFISRGGPQRFSDSNISYVLADSSTGDLTLGLAGILNAGPLLKEFFTGVIDPNLIPNFVQVSEAVYIDYDNNNPGIFYALGNLASGDTFSSSGQSSNDTVFNPASVCTGGGATGPFDFPEAGCSFSADFQVTDIAGATPQTSLLPDVVDPDGSFTFIGETVTQGTTVWYDPVLPVIGYAVVLDDFTNPNIPKFASVELLPRLGIGSDNNDYEILLDQGGSCNNFVLSQGILKGGDTFNFAPSVSCFFISGINPELGINPGRYLPGESNPVPFSVGLTFDRDGVVSFELQPQVVPEPLTLLGASAAVGIGSLFKRHSSKSRKA